MFIFSTHGLAFAIDFGHMRKIDFSCSITESASVMSSLKTSKFELLMKIILILEDLLQIDELLVLLVMKA